MIGSICLRRKKAVSSLWGADPPGQDYRSIGSDNVRGGDRATSHLIRRGRKRIAFLGDFEGPEIDQRDQGCGAVLAR